MIVLFDTCIILDYLMDRKPFSKDAFELVNQVANNRIEGFITVKSMMDIHYVVNKLVNNENKTRKILKDLTQIFEVFDSKISDYEDAVMSLTGEAFNVDYFVTRNTKNYKNLKINVKTPKELIKVLNK